MSRKIALMTCVAAVAVLAADAACADDWTPVWSTLTLAQSRADISAVAVGNTIVFAGGEVKQADTSRSYYSNFVDIYNTVTHQWSSTTLSHSGELYATGAAAGKAYFASGYPGGSQVDIYDTSTGLWSTAALSQARFDATGASDGNSVVFAGGGTAVAVGTKVVDIYNAQADAWSTANLSQAHGNMAAVAVGDQMLFAGGDTQPYFVTTTNRVDIYNTTSGSWTTASLSKPRDSVAAAAANGYAFFAGGYVENTGPTNVVDIYNSSAGTWSTTTLSSSRTGLLAASALNEVFFAGGNTYGNVASYTVDIFNTTTGRWSTTALPSMLTQPSIAAVGNQVFFAGGYFHYPSNTTGYASNLVDLYTIQNYPFISSNKFFNLGDNTTVSGLMQLSGGSLGLAGYTLAVGSMSGFAQIDLSSGTLTTGSDNTSTSYSGRIRGGGQFIKTGSGALTLSASNNYTAPTTVNQGKLLVDGLLISPVTVNSGAVLGGTGHLGSVTVTAGGVLAPGDASGILVLSGGLSLLSGATMAYDLDMPLTSDEVSMPASLLALNGQQFSDFNFTPLGGFGPGAYTLIDAGTVSGGLGANTSGTINGLPASLSVQGNDLVLTVVPEPSCVALLGAAGIVGMLYAMQRRA